MSNSQPSDDAIAAAWYPPDQLDRQRQSDDEDRAFRHMLERRRIFHEAVAAADDPTPEDRADLWQQAHREASDAHTP